MTDLSTSPGGGFGRRARDLWSRTDGALATMVLVLLALVVFDPDQLGDTIRFALDALIRTAPIIFFAVLAVGYMKASGAETLLSKAFTGREGHMIVMAALLGGLSPFCSCQVIPFVAAMLALGVPLAPVMAFWLASPLMDPGMFIVTAGTLGMPFAIGKTLAAVGLGLFGGAVTMMAKRSPVFADPLREKPQVGGCCGVKKPYQGEPVWKFWTEAPRRETFRTSVMENAVFLLKWLALAYVLESLMLTYVPADWIAGVLGGDGAMPILLGALVGMPAYLNGYAAVPLVGGLMEQGMAPGAAMSFVIAGGVSCIPAAVAVWALVKPRVFAAYLGLAVSGAVMAGVLWQVVAG
ncbi:permease [Pseudooceanicola sp. LIPI14-2-Ac024]|uniref:permease n=1 Tax=Pseudooceanicola sp. LIPI14-2-Ac024 TaxID=3344875 RepID=UPI0035D07953